MIIASRDERIALLSEQIHPPGELQPTGENLGHSQIVSELFQTATR